jgi:hypothetical protein
MDDEQLIAAWRGIINGPEKSWVLFGNGTCVILMRPQGDLAEQARELLREWGPVQAGTPAGDFATIKLDAGGWAVTGHHNDILTYVGPDEFESEEPSDLLVGLLGRSRRAQDAEELRVIHVEDRRPAA